MSTEIVMPRLSDTMDRGTVGKWNKRIGDAIRRGEVLLEIETDKANMDLEAYGDGFLARIMVDDGESAPVGAPIGIMAKDEAELSRIQGENSSAGARESQATGEQMEVSDEAQVLATAQPPTTAPPVPPETPTDGRIKASPLARRVAQQRGIDLSLVQGTGPGGRITRDDVEAFGGAPPVAAPVEQPQPAVEQTEAERLPEPATVSGDQEIELSRMQQTVGRRLVESKLSAPHFYVTAEIDMTHASRMRSQINEAEPDLKVSFNDLIVKAAGVVLTRFPQVNASYREGKVVRHGSVNVGIAVDLPAGLTVPVIRDVDRRGLRELSGRAKDLAVKARDGKLKQQDLEAGTFTVSNLGMFGVDQFTAIINPPESAILAVGAIAEKPVVVEGEIVIRQRMRVTLSCDHRMIYGADAAAFLAELRRVLEHPVVALL